MTKIMGTLPDELGTFMVIYSRILLRIRNVSDKSCRKNSKHILCSIMFSPNIMPFEIMWKNMVEPDKPLMVM